MNIWLEKECGIPTQVLRDSGHSMQSFQISQSQGEHRQMRKCLKKGKLQFGTGCKRMNKETEDTLCPKSSLWKEMRTVIRCCDRLPVEDRVPTFHIASERRTVVNSEKYRDARSLLSCPKRVEKTVSKSHDFSVTESIEVQVDGFWLWVLFGGPYTDLSDPSGFQGPLC